MQLGVSLPHTGALASPAFLRDFAVAADELGFGALLSLIHI